MNNPSCAKPCCSYALRESSWAGSVDNTLKSVCVGGGAEILSRRGKDFKQWEPHYFILISPYFLMGNKPVTFLKER